MAEGRRQHVHLLGGFELLVDGAPVAVQPGSARLVAFLALAGGNAPRSHVLEALWPERDERRAGANLRAAIWRLPAEAGDMVQSRPDRLRLVDADCDVDELRSRAFRLADPDATPRREELAIAPFLADVLPSWYEDWVLVERERVRQIRVHGLEALCERLAAAGRFGEAIEAGLAAAAADPLRESAHRVLIEAHLAEGNTREAVRQYELFRRMLHDEVGGEPSASLRTLVMDAQRR